MENIGEMLAKDMKRVGKTDKEGNLIIEGVKDKVKITKEVDDLIREYSSKTDLARKILKIQPIYYDKYRIWWIWDNLNFKWKVADETDVLNLIRLKSNSNTINSKEKAEIIEALKQESRLRKPKPTKDTWKIGRAHV